MKRNETSSSQSKPMRKPDQLFLHATLLSLCDMQSVEAWLAYSSPQTRLTLLMHVQPLIKMVQEQLQSSASLDAHHKLLNTLKALIQVRSALVAAPDSSLARDISLESYPILC